MQKITKVMAMFLSAIILACSFTLYGCGDDFFPVVKVSFVTNGERKSSISTYVPQTVSSREITKEEFLNNANINNILGGYLYNFPVSSNFKIPKKEKGKSEFTIERDESLWTKGYFARKKSDYSEDYNYYEGFYYADKYTIVYIKIVDNSTIIIKHTKGETTYTVTSFTYTKLEFED